MGILGIIIAILVLSIIIVAHEFGHLIFAKIFKVPVREFSLGMGKRIFSFIKGNTRYSLKLFPIGGSCAMVGEEDIASSGDFTNGIGKIDNENQTIDYDGVIFSIDEVEKRNFAVISPIKKMLICFGGPLFNFLLAFIVSVVLISMSGIVKGNISEIVINSPASTAIPYALEKNDEIIMLETKYEKQNILSPQEITMFMILNSDYFKNSNMPLGITFVRNDKIYKTICFPKFDKKENMAKLGIMINYVPHKVAGFDIIKYGFHNVMYYIDMTIKSLKLLFRGKFSVNDISGPVGTVAVMGDSIAEGVKNNIKSGLIITLELLVLISANLGVMNLLPIPALDGGRIVFSIIEMIIGKRINEKVEKYACAITMILLLFLMMVIFGLDLYKIVMGQI